MTMHAIIMAGGKGTRLAPYTAVLPKPLMPVGDTPILGLLLRQLSAHGIKEVTMAVGHLAPLLIAYFGSGERYNLKITYHLEEKPLGTAGAIGGIAVGAENFLVLNGDLLTDLNFSDLIAYHRSTNATATVGICKRTVKISLGVVTIDDNCNMTDYVEKPSYDFNASMGVYVFGPRAAHFVKKDVRLDLPELILLIRNAGEKVIGYTHHGYWLDIGRPEDYEQAQKDVERIQKFTSEG